WQRCRLAAHGRRRGMPMKRSEHSAVQSTLWVISGHLRRKKACPLYPQKRTLGEVTEMPTKGQKRTRLLAR
ncbi:MAG: hypothetical protein WA683_13730, partial [Pseudolabrys sp.]